MATLVDAVFMGVKLGDSYGYFLGLVVVIIEMTFTQNTINLSSYINLRFQEPKVRQHFVPSQLPQMVTHENPSAQHLSIFVFHLWESASKGMCIVLIKEKKE